ncbi:MAG: 1,2-phenylacetyl-CoA epoxidase subunit PaaC [Quisquiliibacterium sp.]
MTGPEAHLQYLIRLGDNALVLGQRLAEWCGHGPALEEDLALTNIALDQIGQARLLLTHAGQLEGQGRDEDALAYFRDEQQFRNWTLLELPNGVAKHDDYAVTIARNFLYCAVQVPLYEALAGSSDTTLAQIAVKSVKEAHAHLRHARDWMVRFGDGTEESHRKAQQALDQLWPYTNEFWSGDPVETAVTQSGVGVPTASLREEWNQTIDQTLETAGLARPAEGGLLSTGKLGVHSEYLGYLLAEMQSLARAHPQARW